MIDKNRRQREKRPPVFYEECYFGKEKFRAVGCRAPARAGQRRPAR